MSIPETKHSMKLRHKAELKALMSQPAKGIGTKKKQKDDEKAMIARHQQELEALEKSISTTSHNTETTDEPSTDTMQKTTNTLTETSTNDTHNNEPSSSSSPYQHTDIVTEHPSTKPSRAQQKRAMKHEKEAARRRAIEEETKDYHDPRITENEQLAQQLDPQHLTIKEIISDGHCLFRAIAHQIESERDIPHIDLDIPPSKDNQPLYHSLRYAAAQYILNHLSSFLPFLTHHDTGTPLSEPEAHYYCEQLADISGDHDIIWGGHAEIVALSEVLHRPVIIYSADGRELRIEGVDSRGADDPPFSGDPPIRISFHKHYFGLGDHYNSVIPSDS